MNFNLNKYYNTKTRIFWHIAFWVCFLAAHTLFYGSSNGDYSGEFYWALQHLPFKMAVTYFVLYFVIPRYLLAKKYVKALLAFIGSVGVATLIQQSVNYAVTYPLFHPTWEVEYLFYVSKMYTAFLGIYPVVIIAAFIKLVKHWYQKENQAQELKRQKLEAELKFLKTQIHPHFLFNTLNNLYALTLKKSDHASEVVLKLSDMLDYMLYEGSEPTVSLEKELEVIETYISLEKLRFGKRLDVTYEVTGEQSGKKIPPMLIIPFVENSFKHGAGSQLNQVWIDIDVEIKEDELRLVVKNNVDQKEESVGAEDEKDGIGLANVQRRLDLLYGNDYKLDINRNDNHFTVDLSLNLNHSSKQELL